MKKYYSLILICLWLMPNSIFSQNQAQKNIPKGKFLPSPAIERSSNFTQQHSNAEATALFQESFNSDLSSWSSDGSWAIGTTTLDSDDGYEIINCASTSSNGSYSNSANDWLISPDFLIPTNSGQILLKFKERFVLESEYDYGMIKISTDDGSNWTQIFSITGKSEWRETILDISSYQGHSIKIAFNLTTDASVVGEGWFIDDLKVLKFAKSDLEINIASLSSQNFPFIYMNCQVDYMGNPIATLDQSNFTVFENGVEQTEYFEVIPPESGGSQRLADIVFVVDVSGSMSEELSAVKANMLSFVNALAASDIDYNVGFVSFADLVYVYNDYNLYSSQSQILSVVNGISIGEHGLGNGGDEPENQIESMALAGQFLFRPGAQKIEIMLTDASAHENDWATTWTVQSLINTILIPNDVTVFPIFYTPSSTQQNQYIPIANATNPNGTYFHIYDNFNTILSEIGQSISNTYLVRYSSSDPGCNGLLRNVEVFVDYDDNVDSDAGSYVPCEAPTIERTAETMSLHNQPWLENTSFTIEVVVVDEYEPFVNSVKTYYKNSNNDDYQSLNMVNTSGNLWSGQIPGGAVFAPGLDYYVSASDGVVTVSTPSINPGENPFQIAILPNQAPVIIHTPINSSNPDISIPVSATVTDETTVIVEARLFYRKFGQILFQNTVMLNTTGNDFMATIPASFVTTDNLEYYIRALDDFSVGTYHGTPENPHFIGVLPDVAAHIRYVDLDKAAYQQGEEVMVTVEIDSDLPTQDVTVEINLLDENMTNVAASSNTITITGLDDDPLAVMLGLPADATIGATYHAQVIVTDAGSLIEQDTELAPFNIVEEAGFNLCMQPGWQIISSPITPIEAQLELLMAPLTSVDALTIMVSNNGIYWPAYNFNQIGDWNSSQAYKVKLAEAGCVLFDGYAVTNKTVDLEAGANYLPVLVDEPIDAEDIFDQLGDALTFAYDISSNLVYWPEGGVFTLNVLEPGKGYLIRMFEAGSVTYPNIVAKAPAKHNQAQTIKNAPWQTNATGLTHIISIQANALNDIDKGDIIAAFNTDNVCVGMVQHTGATNNNIALVVNGDDNTTDAIDGMVEGEAMRLMQYRPATSEMLELYPQWDAAMSQTGNYAEYGLSGIISFKGANGVGNNVLNNIAIYPNPTTGLFHIDGIDGATTIEVLNSTGRMVNKFTSNNAIEINLSNIPGGIYYLRLVSEKEIRIEKIVVE